MALYAVIDTNVLVSALLSKHPDTATVLLVDRMIRGELIPLFSAETISEYREVLSRKKFKFESTLIEALLSFISNFGLMLELSETGEILPDMKDLPFYEVVAEKRKTDDAYLVTGNQKHFPIKPFIVTPKEMLDIMDTYLNNSN